jgi:hypothetical protein
VKTLTRTLAAAIAIAALAPPIAHARPLVDPQPSDTSTPSARVQDLRHLKAGQIHTSSLAETTSKKGLHDLGHVYWAYDYPAGAPRPTAAAVDVDDGPPWMTIGVGIAGACLLVGAGVALAGRTRMRSRSPRVAT